MAFDFKNHILHHMQDSYQWHLPFPGVAPIDLPEPFTVHTTMMLIAAVIVLTIFLFIYNKKAKVPTGATNLFEAMIIYIRDDVAIACLGEKDGIKMLPLLLTFFFFILFMNLMGLIPIFATATSNINITGALAFVTFSVMVIGSIYKNGIVGFFKAFVPSGVPGPVLCIVVPLEFLGLFIKSFALMIRLFANMLGGHLAISSLVGLVIILGAVALPLVALAVFIYILEILVVFIQAYVFTLLTAIFISQMHHPEH